MDQENEMAVDLLAQTIARSTILSQRVTQLEQSLNEAQQQMLVLQGEQNAFGKMFLNGKDITLQQALEDNLQNLKDKVEAILSPPEQTED
jgi:predicted nuclease with TOPRIM domain